MRSQVYPGLVLKKKMREGEIKAVIGGVNGG
jgi:hypothetical protein